MRVSDKGSIEFHDISGVESRRSCTGCANDLEFQAGVGTGWQGWCPEVVRAI